MELRILGTYLAAANAAALRRQQAAAEAEARRARIAAKNGQLAPLVAAVAAVSAPAPASMSSGSAAPFDLLAGFAAAPAAAPTTPVPAAVMSGGMDLLAGFSAPAAAAASPSSSGDAGLEFDLLGGGSGGAVRTPAFGMASQPIAADFSIMPPPQQQQMQQVPVQMQQPPPVNPTPPQQQPQAPVPAPVVGFGGVAPMASLYTLGASPQPQSSAPAMPFGMPQHHQQQQQMAASPNGAMAGFAGFGGATTPAPASPFGDTFGGAPAAGAMLSAFDGLLQAPPPAATAPLDFFRSAPK